MNYVTIRNEGHEKNKIPNPKHQITNKHQNPMTE